MDGSGGGVLTTAAASLSMMLSNSGAAASDDVAVVAVSTMEDREAEARAATVHLPADERDEHGCTRPQGAQSIG